MLKEIETEERTGFFCHVFIIGAFQLGSARALCPPLLATPMALALIVEIALPFRYDMVLLNRSYCFFSIWLVF